MKMISHENLLLSDKYHLYDNNIEISNIYEYAVLMPTQCHMR